MATVTYPPEMLPSPDEGDEAEVVVVDPNQELVAEVEFRMMLVELRNPTPNEGRKDG